MEGRDSVGVALFCVTAGETFKTLGVKGQLFAVARCRGGCCCAVVSVVACLRKSSVLKRFCPQCEEKSQPSEHNPAAVSVKLQILEV